ncbi:hypothetical protein JG688_00011263 [Phytophthora aleatoria]|uniref:RxLR effector protein n=1 Tax=Phytophthora aleatoria TaxID=2496075 RepID=A0A8J5J4F9_9STRA|nr:hypothetical protein JG688_00011263 [Phytophthora aleatoria]
MLKHSSRFPVLFQMFLTGMLCTKLNHPTLWRNYAENHPDDSLNFQRLWWFGSPSTNASPYRSLVPIDLPTIRARKRLSDFRYIMIKIENIARKQQTYVDNPSLLQARQMLSAAMSELPMHDQTQRNYTRRSEHLQWSTIVNILRKQSRLQRISNQE